MARSDPWTQFDDAPEEMAQPDQQAMGMDAAPVAAPVSDPTIAAAAPASDPFAQFSEANPAPLVDTPGEVLFKDEQPETTASKLDAAQEAELLRYLQAGDASGARAYAASVGFGGPDNFDDVVAAAQQGLGVNSAIDYQLPKALPDQGAGAAFGRGFADIPTFGALDELGAVVDTLGGTEGRENVWDSDRSLKDILFSNIDVNRGIIQGDEENHPVARLAGQIIGGLPIPSGMRGVALSAGTKALRSGATMDEARKIAAVAARNRMTVVGAGTGAAYGTGSAEGGIGERAMGAAGGAAVGAGSGAALGAVAQKIAPRIAAKQAATRAAPLSEEQQFVRAAQRQEIDYLAADRPNALPSQWATAVTNLTLGGIPLTEAAEKTVATAKVARDRIAQTLGGVADETGAGQAAQRGAKQWIEQTEGRGGLLFESIPIPAKSEANVTQTRAALAEITRGMESNKKLSAIWTGNPRLKATLDALTPQIDESGIATGGKVSWQDLKRLRSIVGEISGSPSLTDDGAARAAMRKFYGALSADMEATALSHSPGAAKAFSRANQYWRGRQARIEGVLGDVLGEDLRKGAQPAFEALNRLSLKKGGDPAKLAMALRSMPKDEADTVRATILSRLGQSSPGRQDATQEVFSPAEFMTQWSKLSDRAKEVLFQNDHRKALDDLVTVASGMKASSKYANTSRTGIAVGALGTVSAAVNSVVWGGLSIAAQIGAGKLLGNPKVARWLAAYGNKPNAAAGLAHIGKLGPIAKSEPAIATDILALQQRLAEAFTQSPTRLAADEGDDEASRINGQNQ